MVRSELGRRVAAVCLVSLALQGFAQAAPRPRVGVVPFTSLDGASQEATRRLSEQVRTELAGRQGLELLHGIPSTSTASARANPEIKVAMEEGKKQLNDLRFDKAAVALRRGIDLALQDVATLDVPAILEAHVNLAVALFRQGEEKDAQAALLTVARLSPDYSLAEGRYPPIFVREFQKARKRLSSVPQGGIAIDGPRGSIAWVDGRELGPVPVEEGELRSGPHYVQVEGSNGERFGQRVEVSKGITRVKAHFGAPAGPVKPLALTLSSQIDAATGAKLQALANASGADELVVGVVERSAAGVLMLGAGLYSRQDAAVRKFPLMKVDGKTVVALGDRIETRLVEPGLPESFPVVLIPPAEKKLVALNEEPDVSGVGALALKPNPRNGEGMRALDRKSVLDGDPLTATIPPPGSPEVTDGGIPWWVWVAGGVGAAALAGGTVYGLSQAGRPVTGTVSARW